MATHGRANMDAFWSGSVTPKILQRAGAPVLLIRVTGEEPIR
jgi:nucleotide-binding universal stress UspA family protein